MPGNLKQNFAVGTQVKIAATNSNLDGLVCKVLGRSFEDSYITCYIVGFDEPLPAGDLAISLTEACLDPIGEKHPKC